MCSFLGKAREQYPSVDFNVIEREGRVFVEVLAKTDDHYTYYVGYGSSAREEPDSHDRIYSAPSGHLKQGIVQIKSDMTAEEMAAAVKKEAERAQQRYNSVTSAQSNTQSLADRARGAIQKLLN